MKNKKIYNLLFEQDEDLGDAPEGDVKTNEKVKARKSEDSVDDQIDSLVLMYEKRAIREEKDQLMESLKNTSLNLLFEQDEEGGEEEGADTETEAATEDPVGSEEATSPATDTEPVPDLDIDKFTIKVARLILNHRNLLDVETAIINRVKNFLDENYGDKFVVRYLDILDEQFGIAPQEFNVAYNEDEPFAVGANQAGTGGGG